MSATRNRELRSITLTVGVLLASTVQAQIGVPSDADIEKCLLEGTLGKNSGRLAGVTRPEHLAVACGIDLHSAVFKTLDEHRRGVTRIAGGGTELDFSDSYKYERAAYLLDRELGLDMVPVSVIRSVGGEEGALVAWISNAAQEGELVGQFTGTQVAALVGQKQIMRLFDALILNVDRRPGNWLLDRESLKLYLIDHSRAFRNRRQLPEGFTDSLIRLDRRLYRRLEDLNEPRLGVLLEDLVTGRQIKALLARRDLILEKIDGDREHYGDAVVFTNSAEDGTGTVVATH